MHHNMEHDSTERLYATFIGDGTKTKKNTMNRALRKLSVDVTSACNPGFNRFPHSSHRKHSGCQS